MPDTRPTPRPTQLQGITDLTLFADIKPGLIDGIFDSRSYTWRLQRVLELLDAARRARREADVMPNPFIDSVARFRGIQFFRFAILPPDDKSLGNKLFLNVTFDGGWEPYIRLIWDPLGTMLDLIFCHCKGYPLAAASSFDDYIRWVRDHEWPSQFFYADSGGTAADRTYLNRLEAQQRAGGDRPGADLRAAQLALDSSVSPQPTPAAVLGALRTLKGLYGLTQFFGMPPDRDVSVPLDDGSVPLDDGSVLLRFAQDFLPDLRAWYAQGLFDPGQQFGRLRQPFERERNWLMSKKWTRPNKQDRPAPTERSLQAGILDSPRAPDGRFARGALVLARVVDPVAAGVWLKKSSTPPAAGVATLISDDTTDNLADDRVVCTVAITYPGLQALRVHERHLESLPAEFTQGMEGRAGTLGDVRINHPQQWNRPRAWKPNSGSPPVPIDLSLIHLVIQLRTCEAVAEKWDEHGEEVDRSALLPRLELWIAANLPPDAIKVLAVEPTWSRPSKQQEPAARDHFGYVDGISQPVLKPSAGSLFWDDAVKTGEVLLGWVNDRGDGPLETPGRAKPPTPAWLVLGTFLVVRKIRQYVDRFDRIVEKAADVLMATTGSPLSSEYARELVRAKLMGRGTDGTPLMAQRGPGFNDFDFRYDADGAQCPFASHVRRANPRAAIAGVRPPRIVRRGMSYGRQGIDQNERGVLFMAYNASIAEQFEVIQRWLTGGNSSGVSSSQPDPLLGVPRVGEPTVFRFAHNDKVIRADLGDQPLCKLEWGLYAFVPSMALLQDLKELMVDPHPAESPPVPPAVEKIGTSVMVGGFTSVKQVLTDDGRTYSAAGYGERMEATLGLSPFGRDNVGTHAGHDCAFVGAVKKAIANAVSEEQAYDAAYRFTARHLAKQQSDAKEMGLPGASVDVIEVGMGLVAHLCQEWFGVVYDNDLAEVGGIDPMAARVRCPGHFLVLARNVFSAYPNKTVEGLAASQAPAVKEAVAKWVAAATKDSSAKDSSAKAPSAPVLNAVLNAIDKASSAKDINDKERNGTVANVMLGLPATLLGSWGKVICLCIADRRLWLFQYNLSQLPQRPVKPDPAHANDVRMDYKVASGALRNSLVLTMAADPVADGIWRTVVGTDTIGNVEVHKDDVVWLRLGSALASKRGELTTDKYLKTAEDLLFGDVESGAPHACPGRGLAIGALLGALAALLLAGQWAPTASPTTLSLKPLLP